MLEELVEMSSFPIMSAGGAASMDALRALEHRGISAVVLGCALYSGALEPRAVAAEFGC
jgi:phosphoribosylformimino-5-aminoimidazole carboxamide ribotide isomerase